MAYKPVFSFPSRPIQYAKDPVPSIADWDSLWTVWDIVTKHMIPKGELLEKPINLRNACIFYLGHIPTFLDIHLSRATGNKSQQLDYYQQIFERGIDPDVDNPELCHDHSEVPETWPPIDHILQYQNQVRDRVKILMNSGAAESNGAIRKALWLGFEHEAMHLETLLYMLVQSEKTLPPASVVFPDFEAMAAEANARRVPNAWVEIPEKIVSIGMSDPDKELEQVGYFGWDNEKPRRDAKVKAFMTKERPVTNSEYAEYLTANGLDRIPASWISTNSVTNGHTNGHNGYSKGQSNGHTNGVSNGTSSVFSLTAGNAVRTVFGQVPLQYALDWPVMASYDELAGCAKWMGGRIPTMEEVRSIYEYVEDQKTKEVENRSENIPAVNSHLVNDGVEETPPHNGDQHRLSSNGAASKLSPNNLFIDLQNANVGFKTWHPTALAEGQNLAGQGEFGGVWEWTSTVLEKHEGFEPMELYPGYTGMLNIWHPLSMVEKYLHSTADFFDGKHNIVLGGSWATHPRLAGRKSLLAVLPLHHFSFTDFE
jgi:formylglycine-generating enzyme required for sulfatase activity